MEQSILDRTEDWARGVLESLGVSPSARGTGGVPIRIPLDDVVPAPARPQTLVFRPVEPAAPDDALDGGSVLQPPRRPPSRRDSQRRREALLKGKEGSRQRRRWENDRLMHVPNAQPPLPSDWEVRPTHPVHHNLPYHVAQFWDRGLREYVNESRAAAAVLRRRQLVAQQSGTPLAAASGSMATTTTTTTTKTISSRRPQKSSRAQPPATFGVVTRDLRAAVKKTPAVKLWVRALEEPMRQFVLAAEAVRQAEEAAEDQGENDGEHDHDDDDTDDSSSGGGVAYSSDTYAFSDRDEDDVVFVGRRTLDKPRPKAASWTPAHREVNHQQIDRGIVFDALGDGEKGSFKRWLAHSLSGYYGLTSQSTTVGSANRVVYVALRTETVFPGAGPILMPRPMWELFEEA